MANSQASRWSASGTRTEALWPKFRELGWSSMGTFAFAAGAVPGSGSNEAFAKQVVLRLTGEKLPARPRP